MSASAQTEPRVVRLETSAGPVRGVAHPWGVLVPGLRYAAPPLGTLRFAPAEPLPDGVALQPHERDGRPARGPAPLQRAGRSLWTRPVGETSEDCLTLDVATPDPRGRAPVLVWIHGGGFVNGASSDPLFAAHGWCREGVVLVTLNYRLGVFGFLDPGPCASQPPNGGLSDLLAALRWVRNHVATLGGDPERVTLAGESAGAMAVGALLASPPAKGLFHGAILQSGGAESVQGTVRGRVVREAVAEALAADGGPATGRGTDAWGALPAERLLDAQETARAGLATVLPGMAFQPVVGDRILPRRPLDAIARGLAAPVPLIVGWNQDEQRLFVNPRRALPDEEIVARMVQQLRRLRLRHGSAPQGEPALRAAGRSLLARYRECRPEIADHGPALWAALETDVRFRLPALRLAARHHGPVRAYEFRWHSDALRGWLGACHAVELPFLFDRFDLPGLRRFTGHGPGADALGAFMRRRWAAFAARGDPDLPDWRPWQPGSGCTLLLDREPTVLEAARAAELAAWGEALDAPWLAAFHA